MAVTMKVAPAVADALRQATIDGGVLRLSGQLPRTLYAAVDKVLRGMGGAWSRKLNGHTFPDGVDPAALIADAIETGSATNRQQADQAFWTPAGLAERMATLSRITPLSLVLEPSAGIGSLVCQIMEFRPALLFAVEPEEIYRAKIPSSPALVIEPCTFEAFEARCLPRFDAVVMNPPFSAGRDIDHTRLAWGLLRDGGRLVGIVGEGAFVRGDGGATRFRQWMIENDIVDEKLPAGTFKTSGTDVAARLIFGVRRD